MSPVGEQFCQACGELLVLAEPPTSDIPVLDYSSDSFSEFIARTGVAAPSAEAPTEVVHEPHGSYTRPAPAPRPESLAPRPESLAPRPESPAGPGGGEPVVATPVPADYFPRQLAASGSHPDSFARTPSQAGVGAPAPPERGTAPPERGTALPEPGPSRGRARGPFEPAPSPAEQAFNGARLGRELAETAGGAAVPGPSPVAAAGVASHADAATGGISGGISPPPAVPGQPTVAPGAALPPPRRKARVLVSAAIVIVLAAGGTALALTLHKRFASNLAAGQTATASSAPVSPTGSPPARTAAPPPTAWSRTTSVPESLLQGATLTGLSCPLPSVCYAIDSAGRIMSDTRPGPWQEDATDGAGALTAISCATTQFCLALDHSGNAVRLLAGTWGKPVFVDAREGTFTAVSCPSSSFCMTTDSGGNAFAYTAGGWRPFTVDSSRHALASVSCVSADFCVAVGSGGSSFIYNGSSWRGPVKVGNGQPLVSVSCASQAFCVAVDGSGHAGVLAGSRWKTSEVGITAAAVACPAYGFCVATGRYGDAVLYHSGSWARAHLIDGSATIGMLTCPSMTGCTAADANGNVMSYVPDKAAD